MTFQTQRERADLDRYITRSDDVVESVEIQIARLNRQRGIDAARSLASHRGTGNPVYDRSLDNAISAAVDFARSANRRLVRGLRGER